MCWAKEPNRTLSLPLRDRSQARSRVDVEHPAKTVVLQFIEPIGMVNRQLEGGQRRWCNDGQHRFMMTDCTGWVHTDRAGRKLQHPEILAET